LGHGTGELDRGEDLEIDTHSFCLAIAAPFCDVRHVNVMHADVLARDAAAFGHLGEAGGEKDRDEFVCHPRG